MEGIFQQPSALKEILAAIESMKSGKTPGLDGIPAEIYKYAGTALHAQFMVISIYKKGDRSNCGNYRGISLLSTAGKILAKFLLKKLQTIAEVILPESQCGFRRSRSTIDMIFTL